MSLPALITGLRSDWAAWEAAAGDAYRRGNLAHCRRCFEAQTRLEVAGRTLAPRSACGGGLMTRLVTCYDCCRTIPGFTVEDNCGELESQCRTCWEREEESRTRNAAYAEGYDQHYANNVFGGGADR